MKQDMDTLAPNYRRARERWPDAPILANSYDSLSLCFDSNAHGMVEHVKSFLESVCITIINEYGAEMPSSNPSTTDLLIAALNPLGLSNSRGTNRPLDKMLSAFNRLADALSEMRNSHGPVAHGKDAFLDAVTVDYSRAYLHAGDAILSILINALDGKEPNLNATREPYGRFAHYNLRIDTTVNIVASVEWNDGIPILICRVANGEFDEIVELRIEPSRLLYGVDRGAYIEVLENAKSRSEPRGADEEPEQDFVEVPAGGLNSEPFVSESSPLAGASTSHSQVSEAAETYGGNLEVFRHDISNILMASESVANPPPASNPKLVDSLLLVAHQLMTVDWEQREASVSRMKIGLKRVLVRSGFDAISADTIATKLTTFLKSRRITA